MYPNHHHCFLRVAASSNNFLQLTSSAGAPTHTLGSGVLVHSGTGGQGGTIQLFRPLINQGTISADVSGKTIAINQAGPLTNSGTLQATGGGILSVDPTTWTNSGTLVTNTGGQINITGNLDNTGATFTLTPTSANVHLGSGGVISGGTITSTGGASLIIDAGTLSGVTLDTDLIVPNAVTMGIQNGLTFANNHKITVASTGSNTILQLAGSVNQTIGGTGEIVFGGTASND